MTQLQITVPRDDTVRLPKESENCEHTDQDAYCRGSHTQASEKNGLPAENRFFRFSRI